MRIQKAFVTGAGGLIGAALVTRLVKDGVRVHALVRPGHDSRLADVKDGLTIVNGDLTNPVSFRRAAKDVDAVFHLAAQVNVRQATQAPLETFRSNVEGTLALLEGLRTSNPNAKLVYASSTNVYGNPRYVPVDEDHPLQPLDPYAASKAAADLYCQAYARSYGLPSAIVRASHVYGPGQNETQIIPKIIAKCRRGEEIVLTRKRFLRDFLYVDDVVSALVLAARKGSGVYNAGSGEALAINSLIRKIVKRVAPGHERIRTVDAVRTSDIENIRIDSRKAKKDLGWSAKVSIDEGLRRTIDSTPSRREKRDQRPPTFTTKNRT